jgi:RNA polymerase sigma-70 factor, ECF subfamily
MSSKPDLIEPDLRDDLLAAVPSLRAFAISLAGDVDRADDLVQDTLLRALANIHRFERGTNLNAWLFTILRNLFHSEFRKRRREVEDVEGTYSARLTTLPDQQARLDLEDFRSALAKLPPDQREALLLVGASGFSYEEAAAICECAVGTIKSRVNRARTRLAQMLSFEHEGDLAPDRILLAAMASSGIDLHAA